MSSVPEPRTPPNGRGFLGVVACGGASRRMGTDKARLEVDGEPLYARAARVLSPLVDEVVLASGRRPLGDRRWRELADAASGPTLPQGEDARGGPLAGLVSGLRLATAERFCGVLFVACDLPGLEPDDLRPLRDTVARGDADVAHWIRDGRDEPLCAAVGVGASVGIEAAFLAGERRPALAFAALRCARAVAPLATSARLTNVNTAGELAAWLDHRLGASAHRNGVVTSNAPSMQVPRHEEEVA